MPGVDSSYTGLIESQLTPQLKIQLTPDTASRMRNTMNSAFTHHHGAKKAGRLVRCAALACALVLGAGSAWAQQYGDRRDDQGAQQYPQQYPQQSPRFRLPPQDHGRRDDARGYGDQRRAPQYQQDQRDQRDQSHDSRRSGRMTPDERRDLRRQINEAGMDLYPPKNR